jgi:tetratricopeptide (TPR) repeat protein
LLAPRKNQTPISVAAMKMNLVKAIRAFQRDTFEGYSESQNELVQVVEANPRSLDALEFLCLTYRELWSYSFQDGADSQTVSQVTQMAATLDPLSPKGGACRVSQMMILGRLPEARSITDSILETFNNAEVFYQFRAEILAAKGDFATATAYTQRAQQMAPGWIKPYFSEAVYDEAQERFGEADRILRKILQMNPDHAQAKAELGKIQYRYFRNLDNGLALLQSAVSGTSRMTPQAEAHARLILAQIYLQRNEPRPALKEAQRCYTLSSTNAECRKIIVQLGGLEKLKNTRVEDREALFLGDEYVKNGDCFAAQAEYKAAFDADPKNALAAYKAGKCLWQLSYTSEALEWLQKAIQADPNLTEAYVALADYSVQRFNYDVASRTLAQIQRLRPNDYKVYLGYGLVEFRRKNYRASIKFAEKALELYNADVDVYVLLAKNYLDMRDFPEAQGYGARAIELDLNSVEAQALYGKILAGLRGSDAGLDYVRHLSSDYPNVIEYQIALVEILIGDEKYAEAKDVLERLAKTGDHKDVLLLLGSVYQKLQNSAGARQAYLNAATLDSGDAEALFRLGLLYLAAHQGPAATKQFSRVLDINSHYPGAHVNLGRAALEQGQTDKALEEATKEKQMNPLMADAYILAADVYEKNGQYTNCASEYQKAAKLRPENSLIYVHMAKCFRQSGSLDIALTMLKLAAKTESGNADIYKEEGALYEMKGDREAASAAYQRYLNLAPTAPDRAAIQMKIIN